MATSAACSRTTRRTTACEPQIPLGSVGTLALGGAEPLPWQVVGYVERCEVARAATTTSRPSGASTCSTTAARASPSWSTPRTAGAGRAPITGAPQAFGDSVKHEGVLYRKLYDYVGKVTYVLGEFYWRLARDQRTANSDYAGTGAASDEAPEPRADRGRGHARRSSGRPARRSRADAVLNAFRLRAGQRAALQRDALPTTFKRRRCSPRSSSGSSSSSSS